MENEVKKPRILPRHRGSPLSESNLSPHFTRNCRLCNRTKKGTCLLHSGDTGEHSPGHEPRHQSTNNRHYATKGMSLSPRALIGAPKCPVIEDILSVSDTEKVACWIPRHYPPNPPSRFLSPSDGSFVLAASSLTGNTWDGCVWLFNSWEHYRQAANLDLSANNSVAGISDVIW